MTYLMARIGVIAALLIGLAACGDGSGVAVLVLELVVLREAPLAIAV
jgi:hypothetical protein